MGEQLEQAVRRLLKTTLPPPVSRATLTEVGLSAVRSGRCHL
jgi:hypothetical protein